MSASKRRAVSAIHSALTAGSLQLLPPKHAETCCQIARGFRNTLPRPRFAFTYLRACVHACGLFFPYAAAEWAKPSR